MADYLHTCLKLHGDLTELLYNKRQDLTAVEQASARIRSSRKLTYEDSIVPPYGQEPSMAGADDCGFLAGTITRPCNGTRSTFWSSNSFSRTMLRPTLLSSESE